MVLRMPYIRISREGSEETVLPICQRVYSSTGNQVVSPVVPRISLRQNQLIRKRKNISIKESLANVKPLAYGVAVAVSRLTASQVTTLHGAAPDTPDLVEEQAQVEDMLRLGGTKRRVQPRIKSMSIPLSLAQTSGRLSSIKA